LLDIKSLVICLAGCVSCLAVHAVVGLAEIVGLGAVVAPLSHAALLVRCTVGSMLLLTVSLAAHSVVFLTLVVFGSARLVVSRFTEVAAAHPIKRVLTDILCRSACHIPVCLAREFGQSARTLIGIAARSCPRSTLLTTPSCVNRDNVVSFARLGAGRPRANTVDAGVPSDD